MTGIFHDLQDDNDYWETNGSRLTEIFDYHYEQSSYGTGVTDCMNGGRPGDKYYAWGLWDGLSPAGLLYADDYGSPSKLKIDYHNVLPNAIVGLDNVVGNYYIDDLGGSHPRISGIFYVDVWKSHEHSEVCSRIYLLSALIIMTGLEMAEIVTGHWFVVRGLVEYRLVYFTLMMSPTHHTPKIVLHTNIYYLLCREPTSWLAASSKSLLTNIPQKLA